MKVTLPENISEITLSEFIKYTELCERDIDDLNFKKRKISIFTKIPYKQIGNIRSEDAERLLNLIDVALATEVEFQNTFTLGDIKFGFIPNLDKITLTEYAMLTTYGVDKDKLHNLMSVLFRPIIKEEGDKYEIMALTDDERYAEMLKEMPLNIVNGALVFFWNLANELQEATQKFLTEELLREMKPKATSRILDGIQLLRSLLKMTFSKLKKLEM